MFSEDEFEDTERKVEFDPSNEDDVHLFRKSDGENILTEERGQHEVTA